MQMTKKLLSILLVVTMLFSTFSMNIIISAEEVESEWTPKGSAYYDETNGYYVLTPNVGTILPEDAVEFNGHHYKVYEIAKDWIDAKEYCESLGGHLATINSKEENSFIAAIAAASATQNYIGGYFDSNRKLRWVTGETVDFQLWGANMPDNMHGIENVVEISDSGTWNDVPDTIDEWNDPPLWVVLPGFICEWEPEGLTTEETSKIVKGTFYGVYENPKWTVIFDGESFVSEITIGKDTFMVNKDFSLRRDFIANENKYIKKEVVVAVQNGEIVDLRLIDDIKANLNLNCTLKLSEQELNYIDKKYSSNKIAVEVYVYVPQLSGFLIDYESIKDVLGLSITVDKISLKSSNPDILTFDSEEQLDVDISPKQVTIGSSVCLGTYYADVNTIHKIPDNLSNEVVFIKAEVSGQKNGESTKDDVAYGINIKNIASEKPSSENQENTVESKKIKEAAKALRRFMKNVTIVWGTDRIFGNELYDTFTEKELESVAAKLFYLLVSSEPIKKSFSDRIFESILGINSDWFSIYSNSVSITETKQTNEHGIVKVKFTCDFDELTWGVYKGTISYEMYGENLPQGKRNAAYFVQADTKQFAEKIEEVANDMRPSISDVLSGASDDAFSVLYNKTFNEIIIEAGYSDVSDVALEYISKIKKGLRIDCPVNVYVYDSNDELLACVENNVVLLSTNKAKVQIEGDSKIIWLGDDTYRIEYESLASYQMKVTVEEYGNDSSRLRTVVIDNIPLKVGVLYTQTVEKGCLDNADYSLLSSEGNRIDITSDTVDLHQHLFENEFELIQNATCVDYGFSCALCTICNKWCREITEATGHNYVKEVEISATCTEAGSNSFTCSLCEDVFSEYTNAIGHIDEDNDNFCDVCNEIVYENCECPCHSDNWFIQFLSKILYAITEFLGVEKYHYCDCGILHW